MSYVQFRQQIEEKTDLLDFVLPRMTLQPLVENAYIHGISEREDGGVIRLAAWDILAGLFTSSPSVMAAAADYLKAYAFDAFLTSFLFCFIGFYNGLGLTSFVMAQGILGSFGVRVPLSYLLSQFQPVSLFHIGLATPCSTLIQIVLCLGCWSLLKKHHPHLQ